MSEPTRHDDTELTAYLDGRDGVSAAYKAIGNDEPPAALDRAILQAARAVVQPQQPAARRFDRRRLYSLAASVMVAIGVLAVYISERDLPMPQVERQTLEANSPVQPAQQPAAAPTGFTQRQVKEEVVVTAASISNIQPAPPAAVADKADATVQPQAPASPPPPPAFTRRQMAPIVDTRAVAPVAANNTGASAAPAAAAAALVPADSRQNSPVVFSGDKLEKIEGEFDADKKQAKAKTTNQLEEVTVTGSRIARISQTTDLSYRDSVNSWLAAIRSLDDELKQLEAQGDRAHAREVADRLRDERALFSRRNPGINLDAALKAQR